MDQIEPVISSSVKGPLGVCHLPRLWLKILLFACGKLPEGYRHGNGGFDEQLCEKLGIDRDAFVAYVENEKPDYQSVERWVEKNARNLTARTVAEWNQSVAIRNQPETLASERRVRFAIEDPTFANAVALNDLDDWAGLHARLTA